MCIVLPPSEELKWKARCLDNSQMWRIWQYPTPVGSEKEEYNGISYTSVADLRAELSEILIAASTEILKSWSKKLTCF